MEERFDVLNELGEFTGKTATREECHKQGLWHRAVYAFIIYYRSISIPTGQWSLPITDVRIKLSFTFGMRFSDTTK